MNIPIYEEADPGLSFPGLSRGNSMFRSIDSQAPLLQLNSVYSNFGSDDLYQSNNGISRQPSTFGKQLSFNSDDKIDQQPSNNK